MTGDKKWFSSLTPLSHKEYVTFRDEKKGKVLGMGVIKVQYLHIESTCEQIEV
jgi:hypothetical protein